jgi:hypothetical protein
MTHQPSGVAPGAIPTGVLPPPPRFPRRESDGGSLPPMMPDGPMLGLSALKAGSLAKNRNLQPPRELGAEPPSASELEKLNAAQYMREIDSIRYVLYLTSALLCCCCCCCCCWWCWCCCASTLTDEKRYAQTTQAHGDGAREAQHPGGCGAPESARLQAFHVRVRLLQGWVRAWGSRWLHCFISLWILPRCALQLVRDRGGLKAGHPAHYRVCGPRQAVRGAASPGQEGRPVQRRAGEQHLRGYARR